MATSDVLFRVLITDASTKHSIALQRYIRLALPGVHLTGHDNSPHALSAFHYNLDDCITRVSLKSVLNENQFDMVIPVGGLAVQTVANICPKQALLPSQESIDCCFDKARTIQLAEKLDIPHPESFVIRHMNELTNCTIGYPCVLKPAKETEGKEVCYAQNDDERKKCAAKLFRLIGEDSQCGILVQDYIKGVGYGFFALYDNGIPTRIFMHQRIREYPVEGGASTAARAYYNATLKDYGLKLLDTLKWNGVAMVEFKFDDVRRDFVLMEINAKFWGSSELALSSGVNFGADLIRVYRGEELTYSEEYDQDRHFYWPLDNDILHLLKTHQLSRIKEYRQPQAMTNVGQSKIVDALKLLRLLKHALL